MPLTKLPAQHLPDRARELWRVLRARQQLVDRYILEEVIFPAVLELPALQEVLFVGTAPYTRTYADRFRPVHLRTIDIDIEQAPYGSSDHIIGSVAEIDAHLPAASLDAVFLNGVFGFGLDDPGEADRALCALARCMRPGATLVVGWNDHPLFRPFLPEDLPGLARFERAPLTPFPFYRYPTFSPLGHVFDFYRTSGEPASDASI